MLDPPVPDLRPYFDGRWYAATYGAGRWRIRWRPWTYYRRRGRRKGHAPCSLFDADWYLARHPDVRAAGLDPLAHYVAHGWREGRQPHPMFDPSWYLARHPEVAAAGVEPLLHYILEGSRQGRQPHPAFDAAGYLADHSDLASAPGDPLAHYLAVGWRQGRRPHPLFDVGWYLDRYPDVALAGIEPLGHFLGSGWREGREPSPLVSMAAYAAARTLGADVNPFLHFLVTEYGPAADAGAREAAVARYAPAARAAGPSDTVRHGAVHRHRRARLRALFGRDVPETARECLLDHVAAVARLAELGHRLVIDGDRAVCRLGDAVLPLDGPVAISAALREADTRRDRPFCFVVLQFNQPDVTARCVASLRRLSGGGRRVHVVVVDNGSEPAVVARTRVLYAEMADVTPLFTGENLGFARGNNVGYRHARDVLGGDFIAVINNDTVVEDAGFVGKCLASFAARPWSVLGPDIVTPDGRHENPWNDHVYDADEWGALGDRFARQRAAWEAGGVAEFHRPGCRSPSAAGLRDPLLQGAAYVFSPVFTADRPRAFDERTFLYGEEFLLAVDCLLAGHPAVYEPGITILHEEGVSTARVPERRKLALGYDAVIETAALCRTRLERHEAAMNGKWLAPDAPEIPGLTADGRTHVLIDLLFCQPGFHGGGEYGKGVFEALVASATARGDVQVWAALDPALFVDGRVWEACRDHAVNVVAVKSFGAIARLVNAGIFDAFFAPAIVVYTGYEYMRKRGGTLAFEPSRTRVVGTLLDVRDLEMAEDWERIATARHEAGCGPGPSPVERRRQAEGVRELSAMYRGICGHPAVDTLVTISAYSAASIRKRVGTDRPLEVLFPPRKPRPPAEPFALPGIETGHDEFALCLNAGRIEKNAATAVAAFDRLCCDPGFAAEHPRLKLLLTGIGALDELGLRPLAHPARFVTLPHLPAERLEHLYRRARFLLYPSFNEGFGYPPLEAMAHGTPSVVADNTAGPEVCGPAAVLCDPFDVGSVMRSIREVLASPPPPAELHRQFTHVAARQDAAVARLVDIVCGRVAVERPAAPPILKAA